jgi:hypothetical protein
MLELFWKSKVVTDSVLDSHVNDVIENEINLSERKLRLYWERVSDLPDKVKGGIEVIRFDADTPKDVLKWVKDNLVRLRRAFESAKHGIPLKVKGNDVKVRLKQTATPQRCPQPKWGYSAKCKIMTGWARKMIAFGMFEHAPDSP